MLRSQALFEKAEARRARYTTLGPARRGDTPEVVVGISPAFGIRLHKTLAGEGVSDMLRAVIEGIRSAGVSPRVVRMRHTADTSFLGLSAANLAGSGIGIGLQAKGTAVIHRADRLPHHNLELFSNAPDHHPRSLPPPRRQRRRLRARRRTPSRWWCRPAARRWARASTPRWR